MKHFFKYFVDQTLLLGLVAVAVTGLLLGLSYRSARCLTRGYFLGLYRHLWADIHLSLALFFLLLILLHLGLNWNWLVPSTRQYFQRGYHKGLWALLASLLMILLICWLAGK